MQNGGFGCQSVAEAVFLGINMERAKRDRDESVDRTPEEEEDNDG